MAAGGIFRQRDCDMVLPGITQVEAKTDNIHGRSENLEGVKREKMDS